MNFFLLNLRIALGLSQYRNITNSYIGFPCGLTQAKQIQYTLDKIIIYIAWYSHNYTRQIIDLVALMVPGLNNY